MPEVILTVVIETDGDPHEMERLVREYLTSEEGPFWQDYGPKAWGGYDGPRLLSVVVY